MNGIFKSLYVHMNCVGLIVPCIYNVLIPKTSNKLWDVVGYGRVSVPTPLPASVDTARQSFAK